MTPGASVDGGVAGGPPGRLHGVESGIVAVGAHSVVVCLKDVLEQGLGEKRLLWLTSGVYVWCWALG